MITNIAWTDYYRSRVNCIGCRARRHRTSKL